LEGEPSISLKLSDAREANWGQDVVEFIEPTCDEDN